MHIATHTEICSQKKGNSIWNFLLPSCISINEKVWVYNICDDCRLMWQKHGVGVVEAMKRTKIFRAQHKYDGPVTPKENGEGRKPVLIKDGRGSTGDPHVRRARLEAERIDVVARSNNALAEWILNSDDIEEDVDRGEHLGNVGANLTTYLIKETAEAAGREQNRLTIWPTAQGHPPPSRAEPSRHFETSRSNISSPLRFSRDELRPVSRAADGAGFKEDTVVLPEPEEFQIGELDTDLQSEEALPNPEDFELQGPPRAMLTTDEFEMQRLELQWPFKGPSDLQKPLPRPPRRDSPMPGCRFDSQNPERDLSSGMYYPRAF
jgi:hypothetical protein